MDKEMEEKNKTKWNIKLWEDGKIKDEFTVSYSDMLNEKYKFEYLHENNPFSLRYSEKYDYIPNKSVKEVIEVDDHVYTFEATKVEETKNVAVEGSYYRHFKGALYKLLHVAEGSEDGKEYAIYANMNGKVYCRPLEMFLSKVDKAKYPSVNQEWRFERQG